MLRPFSIFLSISACFFSHSYAQEAVKPIKPTVAVYDLHGSITESGSSSSSLSSLNVDTSRPLTLFDLSRSLNKAILDPNLKAVVIDPDEATLSFSQALEIRRLLLLLRAANKDVWIYTEGLSNITATLGSAANHFTLLPEANCEFHGINAESLYFKDLLDKVGIKASVIHIGDFKSFGENYYRNEPSEFSNQQNSILLDSIYQNLVTAVADGRKLSSETVKKIINEPALDAKDMVKSGIADHLWYRTEFVQQVHEAYGKDTKFDHSYELPNLDGPEISGLMDVIKLAFSSPKSNKAQKDYIAIVPLEGDITSESISPVRTQILKLANDPKAKALVLRVNSPGGSAMASDVLWEATQVWKKTNKPFVVSMGSVAASGGYYVSTAADRIFAESGTITGSIGVVGMKFVLADTMKLLGVHAHSQQRGNQAATMSMTRDFSPEEEKAVRSSMTKVYQTFKNRVTSGRAHALKGDLEPLAGGRVYSGTQALEIGLVDEIGGLSEAIAYASSKANTNQPDLKLLPEPKSALDGFLAQPKREKDDELIQASHPLPTAIPLQSFLMSSNLLQSLPPESQSAIQTLLKRIQSYQKSEVLLLAPETSFR